VYGNRSVQSLFRNRSSIRLRSFAVIRSISYQSFNHHSVSSDCNQTHQTDGTCVRR